VECLTRCCGGEEDEKDRETASSVCLSGPLSGWAFVCVCVCGVCVILTPLTELSCEARLTDAAEST